MRIVCVCVESRNRTQTAARSNRCMGATRRRRRCRRLTTAHVLLFTAQLLIAGGGGKTRYNFLQLGRRCERAPAKVHSAPLVAQLLKAVALASTNRRIGPPVQFNLRFRCRLSSASQRRRRHSVQPLIDATKSPRFYTQDNTLFPPKSTAKT